MDFKTFMLFTIISACHLNSNKLTIQERLGYDKDSKLLIIHAEDLGVAHAENRASLQAIETGSVNSASIMVPCPWFPEVADYARNHPEMDFGLHLTLTSEWKNYKWGPVSSHNTVPGLIDDFNYFYEGWTGLKGDATPEQVEIELRSQIDLAIESGINITHLDSHMFSIFLKKEYVEIYKRLGREYKIPVLLDRHWTKMRGLEEKEIIDDNDIVIDRLYMALPDDIKNGFDEYYRGVLEHLKSGFNVILLHAAFDNDEMKAITKGHLE